jgi:two-component system nitrate/nitrite response regulator NarL
MNDLLSTHMTERENQILACLVNGLTNKVIARQLGSTEATVKVHVKSIIRKLWVKNRTQAAIWAYRRAQHRTASPNAQFASDHAWTTSGG